MLRLYRTSPETKAMIARIATRRLQLPQRGPCVNCRAASMDSISLSIYIYTHIHGFYVWILCFYVLELEHSDEGDGSPAPGHLEGDGWNVGLKSS